MNGILVSSGTAMTELDAQAFIKRPFARMVIPEDDGTFRAEIQEFPGCIATGDTPTEALEALSNVALSWVMEMSASGKKLPEPMEEMGFSGKLALRLPKSLHRRAAFAAEREGVSLNQFIATGLAEQIGAKFAPPVTNNMSAQILVLAQSGTAWPSLKRVATANTASTFSDTLQGVNVTLNLENMRG